MPSPVALGGVGAGSGPQIRSGRSIALEESGSCPGKSAALARPGEEIKEVQVSGNLACPGGLRLYMAGFFWFGQECKAALSWALMPRRAPFTLLTGEAGVLLRAAAGAGLAGTFSLRSVDLLHLPGVSGHPAAALHDQQDRERRPSPPTTCSSWASARPVPRQLDLALLLREL